MSPQRRRKCHPAAYPANMSTADVYAARSAAPVPTYNRNCPRTRKIWRLVNSSGTALAQKLQLPPDDILPKADSPSSTYAHVETPKPLSATTGNGMTGKSTLCAVAPCMFFGATICGRLYKTLLDSGATDNFIPRWMADQLGLRKIPLKKAFHAIIADGTQLPITHYVRTRVRIACRGCFRVMESVPYLVLGI